jgi:sirohydrochlorin ferrochelatase
LIIAAHGDCGGKGGNVLTQELAHRMRQTGRFAEVAVGFMRGQPSIEEAAARIASDTIRIYPLFLGNGYYVSEAIPRRLAIADGVDALGHHIIFEEPLGLNAHLPGLLASAAAAAAIRRGIPPSVANLLLVAHGSERAPNSAETARQIMRGIIHAGSFSSVDVSFLEEAPFFSDAIRTCARPTLVLGLFAGGGMHATDDVQEAIRSLGDNRVFGIDQLGGYASIIELIASDLGKPAHAERANPVERV